MDDGPSGIASLVVSACCAFVGGLYGAAISVPSAARVAAPAVACPPEVPVKELRRRSTPRGRRRRSASQPDRSAASASVLAIADKSSSEPSGFGGPLGYLVGVVAAVGLAGSAAASRRGRTAPRSGLADLAPGFSNSGERSPPRHAPLSASRIASRPRAVSASVGDISVLHALSASEVAR